MRGKLLFVTGIAVGYVLGARAGRQRYEQIKSAAESVWNTPVIQSGVDSAKDFALARVGDVSDSVLDGIKKLIAAATNSKQAPYSQSTPSRSYSSPTRSGASGSAGPSASVPSTESYTVAEPVDAAPTTSSARASGGAKSATTPTARKKPSSSESE